LARDDGQVQLLTTSGEPRRLFRADPEFVGTTAYSADGRYLVTAGDLGARLWTSSGDPIGGVLPGELDAIFDVAFSPDATLVATMGYGGVVRLYDVATGKELGSGVTTSAGAAGGVAFTADGQFLVAHYPGGIGFTMPASIDAWKLRACEIAGRTLTRDEWRIDVPGRPYAPACR
jgi:WD40 repeat protein